MTHRKASQRAHLAGSSSGGILGSRGGSPKKHDALAEVRNGASGAPETATLQPLPTCGASTMGGDGQSPVVQARQKTERESRAELVQHVTKKMRSIEEARMQLRNIIREQDVKSCEGPWKEAARSPSPGKHATGIQSSARIGMRKLSVSRRVSTPGAKKPVKIATFIV